MGMLYEKNGGGKFFVPKANFTPNTNSGRGGVLAWDACGGDYQFDNGDPIRGPGSAGIIVAALNLTLRGSQSCGRTFNYPGIKLSSPFSASDGNQSEGFSYFEVVDGDPLTVAI